MFLVACGRQPAPFGGHFSLGPAPCPPPAPCPLPAPPQIRFLSPLQRLLWPFHVSAAAQRAVSRDWAPCAQHHVFGVHPWCGLYHRSGPFHPHLVHGTLCRTSLIHLWVEGAGSFPHPAYCDAASRVWVRFRAAPGHAPGSGPAGWSRDPYETPRPFSEAAAPCTLPPQCTGVPICPRPRLLFSGGFFEHFIFKH